MASKSINFGILLYPYQPLDVVGPADILVSTSNVYMKAINKFKPISPATLAKAREINIHHVGETMEPVITPSQFRITPTTTLQNCPELDYLLLGGPDPTAYTLTPGLTKLVQDHVAKGKIVFTTCTGGIILAQTGVLDGKNATTNHQELEWAMEKFPKVNWTREKKWIIDGQFWTGSGASAGMDMVAQWVIENFGFDVAMQGFESLDYEPRDIDGKANTIVPWRTDEKGNRIPPF